MHIRIDFRLILPGVLIFLIGLAFFAVWLVLAIVSFFLFFIPALHGIFYFVLDLLMASLFLMAAGALIALSGARGWWGAGWSRGANEEAWKDRMKVSDRVGEFIGIAISLLVLLYFYESQVLATGFFTSTFGQSEQLAFYGPIILGMVASFVRGTYGRKNAVRPLQSFHGAVIAVTAFWLLYTFPFEFTHLTALFPSFIQIPFWWVSNPVGQLLFFLAGIGGLVSMATHAVRYASVRGRLASSLSPMN
ncbi:MAG: hypothetical protein LYZ69_05755 [Nitrososphaerales archaeon]|nr:hypothetical protein [Nitrososphaerales archaeon]